MASLQESSVVTKHRDDCSISQVIIFKKKAQVTRQLEIALKAGTHELHIAGFSNVDEESIRVDGGAGTVITDVKFQLDPIKHEAYIASRNERENKIIKDCDDSWRQLENYKYPFKKELIKNKEPNVLEAFFKRASDSAVVDKDDKGVVLGEKYFEGVKTCLEEYRRMHISLCYDKIEMKQREKELIKIKDSHQKTYDNFRKEKPFDEKECLITLDCPQDANVVLTLRYAIKNVSWIPSYDLRLNTEESVLKLSYYGTVTQHSSEDWVNAKIFLSTAEPIIGGAIPQIPITKVSSTPIKSERNNYSSSYSDNDDSEDEGIKMVDTTTSTSYEIEQQATIPSDNKPHRMTIAVLDFKPELHYTSVPRASPLALLQAKFVNTSSHIFLAGDCQTFLDNSFVSKGKLPSISLGEPMTHCFGEDSKVQISYEPLSKSQKSYNADRQTEKVICEQLIKVMNGTNKEIKVLVQEGLPQGSRGDIEVTLLSPTTDPEDPENSQVVYGDDNEVKVEWDLSIPVKETGEATLKYSLDKPVGQIYSSTKLVPAKSLV